MGIYISNKDKYEYTMEFSHDDTWEQFLDEFYDLFSIKGLLKHKVFICGSYLKESFKKLEEVKKTINSMENYLGFLELKFEKTHNENLLFKFDLLAKFSDEILLIIEHDRGGHMIELGIILATKQFLQKTSLFVIEHAPITNVLTRGGLLAPFFIEDKTLFYFDNLENLKRKIESYFMNLDLRLDD